MPSKLNVETLFRKHLGKETADAILAKIDKMTREKATTAQIEKAIITDISTHIEKEVVSTVIAKIGPLTPIKVKPIQVDIKSVIGPKINVGIGLKLGPGPYTKGSK